jgi:alkanesulfonate monooxygenase SsuD/methylene tetrahydromethanopterin reductase-like flavin-dependent oxidoreductase (luciferase family)
VAQVPAGDAFTPDQRRQIDKARARAGRDSGLEFHVYVGPTGDQPRAEAQRLHRRLPDAPRAVLVAVDPRAHALEIVTGALARRILDDPSCGLAALSMQTAFAAGDLAGGIVRGLNQLGDHARQPEALHTDQV